MKTIFHGYYQPTEQEFDDLWQNCLFVLDTNVLLNLYRYSPEASNKFLTILDKISDRLWIPHQVALEYQENRLGEIATQMNKHADALNTLRHISGDLSEFRKTLVDLGMLNKTPSDFALVGLSGNALADFEYLFKKFKDVSPGLEKEIEQKQGQHPDLSRQDNIRDVLTTYLAEKVGPPYSQKRLLEIYELGEKRYKSKIPPGWRDNKNGEKRYGNLSIKEKFGDLILWYQTIDKAKEAQKSIIFITDDNKDDWWWKAKGDKTIGPRPELVTEIKAEANVSFHMYNSKQFIGRVQHYFEVEVTQNILDEIRNITGEKEAGSGVNLSNLNLSGKDFSGENLSYYNFDNADLSRAALIETDLSYTDLSDANLSYANLSGADLSHAYGYEVDLSYADLNGADLRGVAFECFMTGANLKRANLSEAYLQSTELDGADLRGANLSEADLSEAYLVKAGAINVTKKE